MADIIRRENLELPGGLLKAESGNILLRGRHKRVTGDEISKIPLVTREDGVVLTVADLGVVKDTALKRSIRVNPNPPEFLLTRLGANASLIGAGISIFERQNHAPL